MLYFHVRIAKKSGTRWAFAFNLSKEQVLEEIVMPLSRWQPFMCGDSPIEPPDVDYIRINETVESSSEIIRKTRWRRIVSKIFPRFAETKWEGYTDEWYITHAGKDVTRDFIRDIDLSKKALRPFVKAELVFIVHGRDHKPVKELKVMLSDFGLNPIVLHEQPSGSRTIVEKLEKYSDVGYAFVILTPDDVGCLDVRVSKSLKSVVETLQNLVEAYTVIKRKKPLKKARDELSRAISLFKTRARQNVVLEFGYFMGLLGRDRVCCLYKGDVELPSDMQGIVYISFKESVEECRDKIIKELKAAGYEIKL